MMAMVFEISSISQMIQTLKYKMYLMVLLQEKYIFLKKREDIAIAGYTFLLLMQIVTRFIQHCISNMVDHKMKQVGLRQENWI